MIGFAVPVWNLKVILRFILQSRREEQEKEEEEEENMGDTWHRFEGLWDL